MSRDLWFEDFAEGQVYETAGATISEPQILAFAMEWDPQRFHLDREAAAQSPYGGLIASGFQTMMVAFRLFLDAGLIRRCSIGSPGMDTVRWTRPVRPGDTLRVRAEIAAARASRSKPDRGLIEVDMTVLNQRDETVMLWRCAIFVLKRPR